MLGFVISGGLIMRTRTSIYNTALYCRLSRDDGNQISMSIENQRQFLLDYVAERGWRVYDIYVDDGFTGTNFDRPEFKRMIKDSENGKIDCIITKDLSRLGRNYVQSGYYTEEYFIEHGVRFIAVNDNVDTAEENNDIAAFHHVLNEFYPKQVSKKVRQVRRTSAQQGKFMNSQAPYGYMKSPQDKHVLIIDDDAAKIVRRIFSEFIAGDSMRSIADRLNCDGIDSPRFYHYKKRGKVNPLVKEKNHWNSSSISQLMKNQVYIGNMVQGKRQVVSFKTKRRKVVSPEDWIIVPNTHEPIIAEDVWDRAQQRFELSSPRAKRVRRTGELSLFSGILKCANCGANLAFSERQYKNRIAGVYICQGYSSKGRMACSSHYISEDTLVSHILEDIRMNAYLTKEDRVGLANALTDAICKGRQETAQQLMKRQREIETRIDVITITLKQLYEDKCVGKLPESVFQSMMENYTTEQMDLLEQKEENFSLLESRRNTESEISDWLSLINKYKGIKHLDRATVMELIDTVTVDESFSESGQKTQTITINYRFIGNVIEKVKETPKIDVS